jgi:hypothetical protein
MEYETLTRPRALTAEQASALVGDPVAPLPPNLNRPTVVADADTGDPVLAYLPVPDVAELRRAVLAVEFGRTSGQVRCRVTGLEGDHPDSHHAIVAYAGRLRATLDAVAPGVTEQAAKTMTEVEGDWRLGESEWTSGVINQSSRLPYHRDAMNFPVWSAMPVLRRAMDGGHLSVPEYDLVLPCRDGWAVFFPGYQLVHGVTPMRPTRPDGYRYSLVYYALRGMQDCFTYAVEREHARTRRTEREQEIARKLAEGEPVTHDMGRRPHGEPDYYRGLTKDERDARNALRRGTR